MDLRDGVPRQDEAGRACSCRVHSYTIHTTTGGLYSTIDLRDFRAKFDSQLASALMISCNSTFHFHQIIKRDTYYYDLVKKLNFWHSHALIYSDLSYSLCPA